MRENYDEVSRKCLTIDFICLPNEGFVDLEDIIKFEKCNLNLRVSVFAHENESVFPLHLSSNTKEKQHHVYLLLITDTITDAFAPVLGRRSISMWKSGGTCKQDGSSVVLRILYEGGSRNIPVSLSVCFRGFVGHPIYGKIFRNYHSGAAIEIINFRGQ